MRRFRRRQALAKVLEQTTAQPPQSAPLYSTTVSSLVRALELAADRTATTIAHGTKQTRREVRERLNEVVNWLIASLRNTTQSAVPVPPVIAREYVSTLKVEFSHRVGCDAGPERRRSGEAR